MRSRVKHGGKDNTYIFFNDETGLITRYQNLLNSNQSHCRRVGLYGNATNPAPKQLYVSCPFSNDSYESFPYRLDILITGGTYSYSKQYIFNVPRQELIGKKLVRISFIRGPNG